jgi:hypothetical protein
VSLPIVVTYNLAAAVSTNIVNVAPIQGPGILPLITTTGVSLDTQRRLLVTTTGNESSNTFTVKGTNLAGFPITEVITGPNASTTQSNLDFKTVLSITALATTAGTTSFGTDGTGSTPWYIMNWHATPTNIALSGVVTSSNTTVTWGAQYTYDDPNNLPAGVLFPNPFPHPVLNGIAGTSSVDGTINDPVTAIRFIVTAGTGTIRGTIIQAGIGSP